MHLRHDHLLQRAGIQIRICDGTTVTTVSGTVLYGLKNEGLVVKNGVMEGASGSSSMLK